MGYKLGRAKKMEAKLAFNFTKPCFHFFSST